jgi:hypothetical protein
MLLLHRPGTGSLVTTHSPQVASLIRRMRTFCWPSNRNNALFSETCHREPCSYTSQPHPCAQPSPLSHPPCRRYCTVARPHSFASDRPRPRDYLDADITCEYSCLGWLPWFRSGLSSAGVRQHSLTPLCYQRTRHAVKCQPTISNTNVQCFVSLCVL